MSGRRNRSNGKPPVAERIAARKAASRSVDAHRKGVLLDRMHQAAIIEASKRENDGDVTPAAAYEVLAMRRQAVRAL